MDAMTFKAIIQQLKSSNVRIINLLGGEPTVHPEFFSLVKVLKDEGMLWMMTTNGVKIGQAEAARLASYSPIAVAVSVDGFSPESHSFIRGYRLSSPLRAILNLIEAGIRVRVNVVLHRLNADPREVDLILSFAGDLGVSETSFGMMKSLSASLWEQYLDWAPTGEQILALVKRFPGIIGGSSCQPGSASAWINVDGTVCPCTAWAFTDLFSNNRKMPASSFEDGWLNGEEMERVRRWSSTHCLYVDSCRLRELAGCIQCQGMAYQFFGDATAPHPWCVEYEDSLGLLKDDRLKNYHKRLDSLRILKTEASVRRSTKNLPRVPVHSGIATDPRIRTPIKIKGDAVLALSEHALIQDVSWAPPVVVNPWTKTTVKLPSQGTAAILRAVDGKRTAEEIAALFAMDEGTEEKLLELFEKLYILGIVDLL
jgi:MoaA/NifB/PqqE/SkfB family radical SAM enzyme/DNA-binding transcriptional regulator YdaS (Cro superfamily)